MASSGMLCRVVLVKTDVSEELSSSIMKVTRIGELGTAITGKDPCHPDDGGAKFFRNVSSYMSNRPRRGNSTYFSVIILKSVRALCEMSWLLLPSENFTLALSVSIVYIK
jgi:hypothetical protein